MGKYDKHLEVAIQAAEASGKILVAYFEKLHDSKQKNKNIRDLVTEVDVLSEENIKEKIIKAFPDHIVNAEESSAKEKVPEKAKCVWHIDPLDGTVNYSQGIPFCAVSIAFEENSEVVVGVVFNPFSEELYFASKGNGACLNGQKISVSKKAKMRDGVYVAAFSSAASKGKKKEYDVFGRMNDATRGVLRMGSAAMSLAYLASGKIDGFWAKNLFAWDLGAGLILVHEAGGKISNMNGKKYRFGEDIFIASNKIIHKELSQALGGLK